MSTFSARLLYRISIQSGDRMDLTQALDLLPFRELDIVITVLEAGVGESPRLVVEHAPQNEEGGYLSFPEPVDVALDAAGSSWIRVTAFTRYIAWRSTGTLDSPATVSLDVLARS